MGRRELDQVIKTIKRVREPGEPPSQSLLSFDLFECDLCKGNVERSKLLQCSFCGRWVCKENCWNEKNLACNSCSGIIQLSEREGELSRTGKENEEKTDKRGFFEGVRQKIHRLFE